MNSYVAFECGELENTIDQKSLHDDVDGLRRINQSIDRGNNIFRSWVERSGGSTISFSGSQGRAEIPASKLSELPDIRRQYSEAVGAKVSVGLGMKISEAEKSLLVAKMDGGDQVIFYSPIVEEKLEEKKKAEEKGGGFLDKFLKKSERFPEDFPGELPNVYWRIYWAGHELAYDFRESSADATPCCRSVAALANWYKNADEAPRGEVDVVAFAGDASTEGETAEDETNELVHPKREFVRLRHKELNRDLFLRQQPAVSSVRDLLDLGFKSVPVMEVKMLEPGRKMKKAQSPAMNSGAGGGFVGAHAAQAAARPVPPKTEGSEHSDGEAARSVAAEGTAPEMTHAAQDLEEEFHSRAQQQHGKDSEDEQKGTEKLQQVKAQVVQALQQVRGQAPILGQIQQSAPETYQAVMSVVQALIALGREVDQAQDASEQEEIDKSEQSDFLPLEKTSWNVKNARANITPEQAEGRRVKYAQGLGLKPQKVDIKSGFPQTNRANLQYGGNFDIAHETAHAMMTPKGSTIRQYTDKLGSDDRRYKNMGPEEEASLSAERLTDRYKNHARSVHDENVASNLEYKIDRRAGVDPHKFSQLAGADAPGGGKEFRQQVNSPREKPFNNWYEYVDNEDERDDDFQQSRMGSYQDFEDSINASGKDQTPDPTEEQFQQWAREASPNVARKFDEGAKFSGQGKVIRPTGLDASINERAKIAQRAPNMPASTKIRNMLNEARARAKGRLGKDELTKAKLPMPTAPAHHHLDLPVGTALEGVGKVKVTTASGGSGWRSVRAGQQASQKNGSPVSSRNPGA